MEVITDAMTFQGHRLVNFSKANRLKFCKIKNPLRHAVKLSKLWRITQKGKNKALVIRKTALDPVLTLPYAKQEYSSCKQAKDLTRDADFSEDSFNQAGNPMYYYLERSGTLVL